MGVPTWALTEEEKDSLLNRRHRVRGDELQNYPGPWADRRKEDLAPFSDEYVQFYDREKPGAETIRYEWEDVLMPLEAKTSRRLNLWTSWVFFKSSVMYLYRAARG